MEENKENAPLNVIQFLSADINYGGRVTDEKDLRLLKCLFTSYVSFDAKLDIDLNQCESLGLHSNAMITFGQN